MPFGGEARAKDKLSKDEKRSRLPRPAPGSPPVREGIRLFVTDIDGTLLDQHKRIRHETREAVLELQRRGTVFTLASGRVDLAMRLFARNLNIKAPLIACNGALIRSLETGTTVESHFIDRELAWRILSWLESEGSDFLIYDTEQIYYPVHSERIKMFTSYNRECRLAGVPEAPLTPFRQVETIFGPDNQFLKIFIYSFDDDFLSECTRRAAAEPLLYPVVSASNSLDINPAGLDKGRAVRHLAEWYGLSRDEVAVAGDQDNDVPMFSEAGIAFRMHESSPLAVERGTHHLPSCRVDGLGRGIRQFLL